MVGYSQASQTTHPRLNVPKIKALEEKTMKYLRPGIALVVVVVAAVGLVALLHPQRATADEGSVRGGSFLTTFTDSNGNFVSRGVITLHADHTMSVIDSGQGGPTFFFTSQLGSWKPDGEGGAVGKTIDFDFPPNQASERLDYTFKFGNNGSATGTVVLTTFPLTGNPLDGGGTVAGTFTFVGQLIQP
jgi:hypothetical protein